MTINTTAGRYIPRNNAFAIRWRIPATGLAGHAFFLYMHMTYPLQLHMSACIMITPGTERSI